MSVIITHRNGCLKLICRYLIDTVEVSLTLANQFEAQALHDDAYFPRIESAPHHAAIDVLADAGSIHQRDFVSSAWRAQPRANQLLLVALYAECLVLLLHDALFVRVEPIAETLPKFVTQLGIELVLVDAPRARIVNLSHLEAEPTTVACFIAEEVLLVA